MNRYDAKMKLLDTWHQRPDLEAMYRKPLVTLSLSDISNIESQLGHSLPADYQEFLRDYNGYIFHNSPQFPLRDGETGGVALFFDAESLISNYVNTCQSEWMIEDLEGITVAIPEEELEASHYVPEWVKWPKPLLPIADSGGNDTTCLVMSGEKKGAIFYWRNAFLPSMSNVSFAADSFDEFMNLLYLDPLLGQ